MTFKNKFILFTLLYTFLPFTVGSWMIMNCVYYQIKSLNRFLENLLNNHEKSAPSIIKKVANIHDKVSDLCECVSAFYVLSYLFIISSSTYFYVFTTYSIFVYTKFPSQELLDFTLTVSLWCIYLGPLSISLIALSSWIQSEGNRTADLVEQLAIKARKLKMIKISYILALQARHRRTTVTCGLYDINWKVLFTVFGSVYSYSVIMIQFHDVLNN